MCVCHKGSEIFFLIRKLSGWKKEQNDNDLVAVHHSIVMTDKTSEPQILGYKPKASEETTEEDNLRDLLNQDTVQKTPDPLGKFWFNLFKLLFANQIYQGCFQLLFWKIKTVHLTSNLMVKDMEGL